MSLMALSVGQEVRSHVSDDGNRWGKRPADCGQLKIRGASIQDRTGRISRGGHEMLRMMLYEAALTMLVRSAKWSWLKAWAMQIARRRGMKKAVVALARRLAVIMHRIWVDGTEFRWAREASAA